MLSTTRLPVCFLVLGLGCGSAGGAGGGAGSGGAGPPGDPGTGGAAGAPGEGPGAAGSGGTGAGGSAGAAGAGGGAPGGGAAGGGGSAGGAPGGGAAGAGGSGGGAAGAGGSGGAPAPAAVVPSGGCSAAARVGERRLTVAIDGRERSYFVVVPAAGGVGKPLPLVFAWHGLGGSGALARRYFGVEAAAAGKAVFVYPDALPLPAFGNRAGWDLTAGGADLRFFDAMYEQLARDECFDVSRVFSTGHSFGGYMTNTLGCQRASVLRAIAPVAGGVAGGACMARPMAAWLAHAMNDGTVPFAQGEAARARWAQASGCSTTTQPAEPAPCVAHDGCRPEAPVLWCVHTQNHAWPAFAGAGIWQFFSRF
jgi:polyhydroxybutyrate depolymerase